MSVPAGTRFGPYEIDELIGEGGMGRVYRARDTRLDRTVAIKQLTAAHGDRFQTEARAVAALNHSHICQVYDIGPDYLVLEYVEGTHPSGPMAPELVRELAVQLADALETLTEAYRLAPWNAMIAGLLAVALVRAGNTARADELVAQLGDRPQPAWGRVWYHLFTRDLDAAAHWFDRMIDDRDPFALVYARAPVTEPLHAHPRWPALAQRMRLPSQ